MGNGACRPPTPMIQPSLVFVSSGSRQRGYLQVAKTSPARISPKLVKLRLGNLVNELSIA